MSGGGTVRTGESIEPNRYQGGMVQPKLNSDMNYAIGSGPYNTIKQDPTTLGFAPSETGFQDNVALMNYLRFGSTPTDTEMYGERVSFGSGTQPSGPNTGIVNPGNPDLGQFSYGNLGNLGNIFSRYGYNIDPSVFGGNTLTGPVSTSNLYNSQPGGSYPSTPGGYYVDPYGSGAKKNKRADTVMANLYRQQWNDYQNRFAPVEDAYANLLRRDTYEQEVANRDRLRSAVSVGNAFNRAGGMEERRMERYGLEYRPDGDLEMARIGATVGGLNQSTQMAEDRRLAAISGGLQGIVSGTMNRQFNAGEEEGD